MKNVSIEKEVKYQLSQEDFYVLQKFLEYNYTKIMTVKQINYYIDSRDFSYRNKDIMIRIRKKCGIVDEYEFTIKMPVEKVEKVDIEHVKVKKEFSISLNSEVAEDIINNSNFEKYANLFENMFEEIENTFCWNKLYLIGQLQTIRQFYLINEIYDPINLDTNTYLDKKDYEIEWESENINGVYKQLKEMLYNLEIRPIKDFTSKNSRFLTRYLNLRSKSS